VNGAFGLESHGFNNLKAVYWNLAPSSLYREAIRRGEGQLSKDGALVVLTGQHTGRSAKDKFVVRDAETENNVWWDNNKAMSPASAAALFAEIAANLQKFMPHRSRPRTVRPKPHKAHAYKPLV